jgi:serine/threonine protein kinase
MGTTFAFTSGRPRTRASHQVCGRGFVQLRTRALAALGHPHICPVFDVGRQEDIDYLVMELLEGETLARRLSAGPLQPAGQVTA